jgi:hypothetical protein
MYKENKLLANNYKSSLMESYRYCIDVYNEGFDTVDQFYSFKQLCQLHVDRCNFYYKKLKPKFGKLQWRQYKLLKDIETAAKYTVNELSSLINGWADNYEKAVEEAKLMAKAEEQLRLEHKIAMEFRAVQKKKDKKELKSTKPIGFKVTTEKPKRKHKNNIENSHD